jgi:hypothetical protein
MSPMSRFGIFIACMIVLVAIGLQPRHGVSLSKSMNDVCVCMPARAGLLVKQAVAKAKAHARSAELATVNATAGL